MSEQQAPLTAEVIFEMFRQSEKQMRERSAEIDRKLLETRRQIGDLTSRVGEIIENMIGGDIVEQFQALGVPIDSHCRNQTFGPPGTCEYGEIDVLLQNGDTVVLIEVKTRLTAEHIDEHIERIEKFRRCGKEKRRMLGAVAGGVVADDVVKYAHRKGLYVIVQSGRAVEIIKPTEEFKAKEW
ncbi:MAG: hypothetical protein FWE67_04165 [Planctomycetaceae bacterium]|nr:hypothetical protein [Planctomycetaceae bacterium]